MAAPFGAAALFSFLVHSQLTRRTVTLAKRSARGLMLVIALFMSLVVPSGTAHATTDYDNLIHTSSSLFVYTDGATKNQKLDISQTWLRDLGQTYAKRVAQNIGWPTNFMTELNDIKSSGGSLGVMMRETSSGNIVEVVGSRDPNARCGFVGDATTGSYQCASNAGYGFIRAGYFTHNSYGGNGCYGSYADRCSNNGLNIYEEPTVQTGTAGYTFLVIPNSILSNYKFYFMDFDLKDPSEDYAGERIPTSAPGAKYVAMGDSYSAGVGTFNYDSTSGGCLRSPNSYVSYVTSQHSTMGTPNFVACGGATTADLYGQNPSAVEPRQLNALTNDTQHVTMTIGGNDVGFSKVMEACVHRPGNEGFGCASDSSVTGPLAQRINALAGTSSATAPDGRQITALTQVLADIASAAPDAKIYIGGYPRLFGGDQNNYVSDSSAPGGALCVMTPGVTVSYSDAQWLNQKADELNGVIQNAVNAVEANGVDVTYVPAALFSGHGLCDSGTPWLNSAVIDGNTSQFPHSTPESLHPTSEGYQNGYGVAFATIVS